MQWAAHATIRTWSKRYQETAWAATAQTSSYNFNYFTQLAHGAGWKIVQYLQRYTDESSLFSSLFRFSVLWGIHHLRQSFQFWEQPLPRGHNFHDVKQTTGAMHLFLKASKTDLFRQGCRIWYFPLRNVICPVQNLYWFLQIRLSISQDARSPLFMLPDGASFSRCLFLNMSSTACRQAGIRPDGFTGYSSRIGAATVYARETFLTTSFKPWAGGVAAVIRHIYEFPMRESVMLSDIWLSLSHLALSRHT